MEKNIKQFDYEDLGYYSKRLLNNEGVKKKRKRASDTPVRILRVLCQRPFFTGSGINLVNLTKKSAKSGFEQFIIFGHPACDPNPLEGIIETENTDFVRFLDKNCPEKAEVPFPVAGMSDKMPYNSTKFSEFDKAMLEQYLNAFAGKIKNALETFHPTIVHSHHLWLVSALCRVLCQEIPVIGTCHNTALRQMVLAPHLKPFIANHIKDLDGIAIINEDQQKRVEKIYDFRASDLNREKLFFHIGQGINTDIFYPPSSEGNHKRCNKIMYVGKLNFSKGVPQLIQAFKELMREENIDYHLYLAGSGIGNEKKEIVQLAEEFKDRIHFLGQISQEQLANHLRESNLFVLPSFYDGFPKVLLESLACGCSAVITELPGVRACIEDACGKSERVQFISLPEMETIEKPKEQELPGFVHNLKEAIKTLLTKKEKQDQKYTQKIIDSFGWDALFAKYKNIYESVLKRT
ncbi:MAG: glycosyltransferase family 4 protein [Promethearchaeia archaeon]